MVRLIDCTYFTKGERLIQNAPISPDRCVDQNEIAVRDSINGWIDSVQEGFLIAMIGKAMTKILLAYLEGKEIASQRQEASDGVEEVEIEEAEVEEVETDEELEFLANGLKESLADYVMYHLLRGTQLHVQNTGAVVLKSVNDTGENTARRQASVWNTMVKRNLRFLDEARERLSNYTICYVTNMVTPINAMNL